MIFHAQYLFDWHSKETSSQRKPDLYQHVFSYASVKIVVHWFQLIKLRKLAMFQDSNKSNRVSSEKNQVEVFMRKVHSQKEKILYWANVKVFSNGLQIWLH